MKRSVWRPIIAVSILIITIGAFVRYFSAHPEVGEQLAELSPAIIILLLTLYFGTTVALGLVTLATLRLCRERLSSKDSLLLTAYSSLVNFFGPLQSGPAFRAVYLKKKLNINLKSYAAATFLYYIF